MKIILASALVAAMYINGAGASAAEPIVLNFPKDHCVGSVLRVVTHDDSVDFKKFAAAQGRVMVPPGQEVIIRPFDDADLSWTAQLKNSPVHYLDLQKMQLRDKDLGFLTNFKSLKHLQLDSTDVTDQACKFIAANFAQLEFLGLSRTMCTGASFHYLSALPHLRSLQLGRNNLANIKASDLARMKELQVLRLDAARLTDRDTVALAQITSLKTLKLSANSGITDKGLKNLLVLKNLTGINLSGTSVTLEGLKSLHNLPKLKRLEINFDQYPKKDLGLLKFLLEPVNLKNTVNSRKIPLEIFEPLH